MENKQRPVIQETKELVQKYHVLEKAQLYAYFALDKRDHFVGKAFKALEKERLIYIHPKLEVVAANEEAFARKDIGTMKAFWVLLDIMMPQKDGSTTSSHSAWMRSGCTGAHRSRFEFEGGLLWPGGNATGCGSRSRNLSNWQRPE